MCSPILPGWCLQAALLLLSMCQSALLAGYTGDDSASACSAMVNAGPDVGICTPAEAVVLQASIDGYYFDFQWSPTTGLDDPNSLNPTATVNGGFTYTLTAFGQSDSNPNLIINGDFESGNAGITSGYAFVNPSPGSLITPGVYTVITSPQIVYSNFPACVDHTYGNPNGSMMVINGGSSPGINAWCQTVAVSPNTYYTFSAFAASINPLSTSVLQFTINGSQIGNNLNLPPALCGWQGFGHTWYSGNATTANICIVDLFSGNGLLMNDYMLDDISLIEACRIADDVQIVVLDAQAVASPSEQINCANDCIVLNAAGSSVGPTISYQWTASAEGMINSGANTLTPQVCGAATYTLQVSSSLNGTQCQSQPAEVSVEALQYLPQFPAIGGEEEVCTGSTSLYEVLAPQPNTNYFWTVTNGTLLSGQGAEQVTVSWDDTAGGAVCTIAENECGQSQAACIPVHFISPDTSDYLAAVCPGQQLLINGEWYGDSNMSGLENFITVDGCDSLVQISLTELPEQAFQMIRYICEGDSAYLGGAYQTEAALYADTFANVFGCDSIITSELVILADPSANQPTVCASQACTGLVNAGPDVTICEPMQPVPLTAFISGDIINFQWTPTTGLSNPNSLTPIATVATTTTYKLSASIRSGNLVTNGDFELGPVGFTTDYVLGTTSCLGLGFLDCAGTYGVLTNPMDGHQNFSPCMDAVGGGNMMVVNGAPNLQNVWCQTINVSPNTDYDFSALVTSVHPASPAILQFSINGNTIGSPFNAGAPCAWGLFSATWNSGSNTTATICILNQNTAAAGNDFALDGISFSELCMDMDQVTVHVMELAPQISPPPVIDCNDPFGCVVLNALGTSTNGDNLTFQWTTSGTGLIQSGANTATPLVCAAGVYNLSVTAMLNGVECTQTGSTVVIDNNALPIAPTIEGPDSLCTNAVEEYITTIDPAYTSYAWSINGSGQILSGQGTPAVIVEWTDPVNAELCLLVENRCGNFNSDCIAIHAPDSLAPPQLEGPMEVCPADTTIYIVDSSDPNIDTLIWSVPVDASILAGQGTDTLMVDWNNSSGGQICLQLQSACDTSQNCMTIDISPPSSGNLDTMICAGNTFLFNGTLYGNGNYSGLEMLVATNGCDSVVSVTVSDIPHDTTEVSLESCDPTQVGIEEELLQNQSGCDSLVITTTAYLESDTTEVSLESCDPTQVGIEEELLQNQSGCDSLVITTTLYLESDTTEVSLTSCDPTQVGIEEELLQNQSGCDSLVITTTLYLESDTTEVSLESCDPTQVGIEEELLQNQSGCDSLVITTTLYLESDTTEVSLESCDPTQVGIEEELLQNQSGCDSLVITTTAYLESDTTEVSLESCDPTQVGIEEELLQNQSGCDSLVITTTLYLESDTTEVSLTSCDPTQVGIEEELLQNQSGCDSLVITTTLYLESDTTEVSLESCDPTQVGIGEELLQNQSGCDSLVITTTLYLESDTTEVSLESCDPTQVGIEEELLQNQSGCDSLVITTTAYLESDTTEVSLESCDPTQVGVEEELLQNQSGCDSLVITTTLYLESDTTEVSLESCDPTQVGVEEELLQNQSGCDSLVITTTLYLESDTTEVSLESCDPTQVGIEEELLQNQSGCDSLVITTTLYLESDTTEVSLESCDPTQVGVEEELLQNQSGCDSLVITTTLYLESDTTEVSLESCDPTQVGIEEELLQNQSGCDSLVITTTLYLESDTTEVSLESCDPTQVGIEEELLQNQSGCDSLVITTTLYLESDTTEVSLTSCDPTQVGVEEELLQNQSGCDSLVITTTLYLESDTTEVSLESCDPTQVGVEEELLQNQSGCDSLVITTTLYLESDTTEVSLESCDPTQVGVEEELLQNQSGCDSLVITTTAYLESDTTEVSLESCDPTQVGVEEELLQNQSGCDSLVITTTAYLESDTTEVSLESCDPTQVGIEEELLQNQSGCDSLVITTTLYLESDTTEVSLESCDPTQVGVEEELLQNQSGCDSLVITTTLYLESDTTEVSLESCDPTQVGIEEELLQNQSGCDSLVITTTLYLESDTTEVSLESCDPTQVGIEEELLQNQSGCDSLVITTTAYLESDTILVFEGSCNPDDVGTFSELLTNQAGCDSLIITEVSLLPPNNCAIQAILVGDTIPCNETEGTLSLLIQIGEAPFDYEWEGDGLHPLGQGSIGMAGTWTMISGLSAGNYTVTVTAANGLSVVLNTPILQEPPVIGQAMIQSDYNGSSLSCEGASDASALAMVISGGTAPFSFLWSDGQSSAEAENLSAGVYQVSITDALGCQDVDTLWIEEPPPLSMTLQISPIDCFDEQNGAVQIADVVGGTPPYQFAVNGGPYQAEPLFSALAAGLYEMSLLDANQCESVETILINNPSPVVVSLPQDTVIQLGDSLFIQALTNVPPGALDSIMWSNGNCTNCTGLLVAPLVTTSYSVSVTNLNGCSARDAMEVGVRKDRDVFIPNAFTPNSDGINDRFTIFADTRSVARINVLRIYDRWGEQLFEQFNFPPNDPVFGWDGSLRGKLLNPAVFVYWTEIEFIDGTTELFKGDLTLVK